MSEAWKNWEGQTVDSRFPLRQFLGESSHSAVFLTERLDRGGAKAAIKLVAASGDAAEVQLARWRQVARLSHPSLLPLYHYGRCRLGDLDLLFAVMEFADETLAEILPQRALTPAETQQMLETVLGALAFLHQQGFVHGDIQAANILAVGDNIKLSSDTVRSIHEAGTGTAHAGAGDPRLAASGSVEPAGDIYSLGITLVQALTQRSPFDAGSSLGHAAEPLPAPFDDIVLHALHPDPQLRWTAADISARLKPTAASAAAGSAAAAPGGVATSAAKPKQPAAKAVAQAPARPSAAAGVSTTSVPLSPVAPLPKQAQAGGQGSGSLLRWGVVVGVAAVLLFMASRVFHRGTDSTAATASRTETSAPPPQVAAAKVPAMSTPAPTPRRESAKAARVPETATTTPELSAPKPAAAAAQPALGVEPRATKAVESKPESLPEAEPSPAVLRSEVRTPAAASTNPEVLQQVLPEVSHKALSTIHGTVRLTIRAQVDATGAVTDAQLDSPSGSSFFNDLALKAARKWQFQAVDSAAESTRSYLLHFQFTQAGPKASATPSR
jgi:TonB family protein